MPIVGEFVHDDPVTRLLDEAQSSDQLVLGARGRGRFERLLLGSTSHHCATHSTVPTAIIRERIEQPPPPTERIVVGFDGSGNALEAVDWACTFASPGSTIDIVAVWEFTPSLFTGEPFYYPGAAARAKERFDEQVTELPPSARRDDIDVTTTFLADRATSWQPRRPRPTSWWSVLVVAVRSDRRCSARSRHGCCTTSSVR